MTHVSRRHLAKGAAWTLPAVAIAASAPSLAASEAGSPGSGNPQPPVVVQASSFAEKCQGSAEVPGGWPMQGYRLVLTVSPADAPAPTIISVVLGNGKPATVLNVAPFELGPGVWEYVVDADSSPKKLTVTYMIGNGQVLTAELSASPHCGG